MLRIFETNFPVNFAESSLKTLEDVRGEKFQVEDENNLTLELDCSNKSKSNPNIFKLTKFPSLSGKLVKLVPSNEHTPIAGVDVTCRRLGRTSRGEICAVRGTIVWRNENIYRYDRLGPFIFHLRSHVKLKGLMASSSSSALEIPEMIQVIMERELQKYVCRNFYNAIILFDGCLSAQRIDKKTLTLGHENGNRILALAKNSKLTLEEKSNFAFLSSLPYPCLLHVDDISGWLPSASQTLGWLFVAKLSKDGLCFRLDVDSLLQFEDAIKTVQALVGGDLCIQGYPETLRAAHVLSILTPSEVIAIQRYLAEKFNLKIEKPINRRRMLFGPFGRWADS